MTETVNVSSDGVISVRRIVDRDGKPAYMRYVYLPGDEVAHETGDIIALAQSTWTQDVIDAFRQKQKWNAVAPEPGS